MKKLSKHDRYVRDLCDLIGGYYEELVTHFKIVNRKRCYGEIDILARNGDTYDLYEVKCSHRPIKAKKQLARFRRLIQVEGQSFFYCGSSRQLVPMAV